MFKSKNINWFYVVLVIFVVALPFSEALISISGALLLIVSFLQRRVLPVPELIKQNSALILFSTIYLVYLVGFIFTSDTNWGMYDLQKNIPFLIVPLAFIFGKQLSRIQLLNLLKLFVIAVFSSALITVVHFYLQDETSVLRAQEFGFIHHIRFSLQVVFSIAIIATLLYTDWLRTSWLIKLLVLSAIIFLFLFLVWHQSFTGLLTFMGTAFVGLLLLIFQIKNKIWKTMAWLTIGLMVALPSAYLYYAVDRYYDVDQIEYDQLDKQTVNGNSYDHDLENKAIENGHYVGLYQCERELEEGWNKRSTIKYNEIDQHGYPLKSTLVRYLTSKNLRKDSVGINELTETDIRNIEAGISNYLLAQKGLSLRPRIYVSIWEFDSYYRTGNANHKSLAQRIEYIKAALSIAKEHFWFGVGTGNWKQAYRETYKKNQSKMDPARYGDAHNQYLNYMVKFGFLGLLWILFAIIYPVVKTKTYQNPIFFLFLVSMLIANLGDSNLETHVGSSYFVLIYCLFISSEKWKPGTKERLVQ